jgi:LysR family transcriptional regulator, regulator of abg operon
MKLHQLQALVASAEAGSIRAAARSLGISQAAVTRALRELEIAERLPLLIRAPSGLTFTEFGNALLTHARLVLNQLQHADNELAELRGQAEGRLSVGITPWLMETFLPETVFEFRKRMPTVRVELYESLMAVAQPLLRDGTMDFVLGYLPPAMTPQEFASEAVLDYQTAILVRRGHSRQDCRSIHGLLDQDWALNYAPDGHAAIMEHLFWRFGARIDERHIVRAHSSAMMQALVVHADMCTWSPAALSFVPSFRDRVVAVSLAEQFEPRQLSIITRRNSTRSSAAHCFIDCLLKVIRRRSRSTQREERQVFDTLTLLT